jgi:4-amino-4-deoxy-L-arabinose transferase-like glycosyltransferase
LVLRLGFAVWWQARLPEGTTFYFPDSESYWELGQSIAGGEPYQFRSPDRKAFRTPGYPLVLAPAFVVGGAGVSPMWGRVITAVCGTAAVAAVWWLAGTMFGPRTAWLAATIAAVYPGAIATSGFVLTEAPFAAAMLLQLTFWIRCDDSRARKSTIGWALAAGAAAGAATLMRPNWLLFTPFAAVVLMLFRGKRPWRDLCLNLVLTLVALCAVMSPWWIRNAVVFGRFVATSLQVGASLCDGLNPQADGSSNMQPVEERVESLAHGFAMRGPPALQNAPHEYRLDRQLRHDAYLWATHHAGRAARLAVIKIGRLWNIWPNEPSMRSWWVRLGVACSFVPVALLAVWSAWRWRRCGWPVALCVLPAVYITLCHTIAVGSIRYRQPAMLALIVLAAATVSAAGNGEGKRCKCRMANE